MYSPGCATDISAIAQELSDDYKVATYNNYPVYSYLT